jgi:hypothetical protein
MGASAEPFDRRVEVMPNGCWEWTGGRNRNGYGKLKIAAKERLAHRVAYEAANGPIPPGLFVCHSCDNPPCVNPAHLWLGTPADNTADMVRKKRYFNWRGLRSGEDNPKAKLSNADVLEIRQLRGLETQRSLGRRFGVGADVVCRIQKGLAWAHVED